MNDLDKRIAELKGLWMKNWPFVCGNPEYPNETRVECDWSTSDSKALGLVDQLVGQKANRLRDIGFALYHKIIFPMGVASARMVQWESSFYEEDDDKKIREIAHGSAFTRPEAICRAYIAAREWMATKAGA